MKDDSNEISTKNLPLRIALFALAFAVAIGAFSIGVKKLMGNQAGYAVVSARADGDAPLYAAAFQLTYHFEGGSKSIRTMKNEISDAYSDALARLYKLTDAGKDYPGYAGNLADLNKRLNAEVTLPRELFDILSDALERTERGEGYSIYAAPLYAEWHSIAYSAEAAAFDPANNADEAERLRAIAAQCVDRDNCRLEIVDAENCVVRLAVSDAFLQFLSDYELPRTVIDLNVVREAYLLRGAAAALEAHGFANGFLSTNTGLTVSLSGHTDVEYVISSYVNNSSRMAATVPLAAGTACSAFTAFAPVDGMAGYYAAGDILRCAARPALSGEAAPLRSAFILRGDGDIVEACAQVLCCFLGRDETPGAADGADLLVYTRTGEDGTILHACGSAVDAIKTETGFTVHHVTSP